MGNGNAMGRFQGDLLDRNSVCKVLNYIILVMWESFLLPKFQKIKHLIKEKNNE